MLDAICTKLHAKIFIFVSAYTVNNCKQVQVNLDMTDHCMTDFCI